MKNFKQSRVLASSFLQQHSTNTTRTNSNSWLNLASPAKQTGAASKRNILTIINISNNNTTKKNPNQQFALAAQQQYNCYSTTTHFPRGASTRLKQTSEDHHHHTIITTTVMSSEQQQHLNTHQHQHDGKCCGGAHSPNTLSDESEFNSTSQTKKKVSGIGIKKKPSNSTLECSHHIDYSQLSANSQNPNLSRPEPSDPNVSYTIEGLLQKKPAGINAAVQFEEEFTEEELAAQQSYEKLLNNNKEFVKDKLGSDPDFFNRIKDVQKPDYMLIGCSDSRVPPDQLTKTQPGQIFIHRNVANLVVNTDVNAMSVLQYAVEVLQVKHVIVMGHTRCGGVMAALTNKHLGLIDHWLRNIKDVYRLHKAEVDAIEDKDKKIHRMIELNIIEQTLNLCKTSVVQNAWAKGKTLHVHGWLCDIETGLIKDLEIEEKRWKEIENIYKYDFDL